MLAFSFRSILGVFPIALSLVISQPIRAQSVRDLVNSHVKENLKDKKKPEEKKPDEKKPEEKKPDEKKPDEKKPEEKKHEEKKPEEKKIEVKKPQTSEPPANNKLSLPRRVIHENFQLDLSAGIGYRGWIPQQYPTVDVDVAHYFTWTIEARARFFKYVNLKRGYYESNSISSPHTPYKSDAAKYGTYALKAAWFLAELGVPIMKAWEPTVRYETRAFETSARTTGDHTVCIVEYSADADDECVGESGGMGVISSYETAVLGVTYYPSKNPSPVVQKHTGDVSPPFFFGASYLGYIKPYQVTVGNDVLDELLFTAHFYGGGLSFGTALGGGVNRPFFSIYPQIGLGAVRLTGDLTLNEAAPSDFLVGYLQGTAKLSFKWAPFKFAPTILIVPSIETSAAMFFFFETKVEDGEDWDVEPINWDFIYAAQLSLIVTL